MQNSAISFSVCIDHEVEKINKLKSDLEASFNIKINEGLELLTITNYTNDNLESFVNGKFILIEQKTRNTIQLVVGSKA